MKGTFFHNQRFLCISIVFMWIKTYAIYKLGFDLQIDSLLEELMLLINPLSFILPLFGIGLLLKENKQRVFFADCQFGSDCNLDFQHDFLRLLYRFYYHPGFVSGQ